MENSQNVPSNSESLKELRHSAAHLLAAAILEYYPHALPTIGPATEDGFYYDFDFGETVISESDFGKIEQKMRELVKRWEDFGRQEVTVADAKAQFSYNPYKLELISEIESKGELITLYKSGEFLDLCRGGHVESPKEVLKHFKLMSVAGAYWRGDSKNKMLTRIYGTAFFEKADLENHLLMLEEAKKRDHRKLGADLELFTIDEMVGKGLIMWLPKGVAVRDEIEKLVREKEREYGYDRVVTPHIAKEELYLTSGHLPYYAESMYPPMVMDDGTYYLKAMNCPHHHRIYTHKPHSYRELPVRLAEYGTCYRNELSGTLAGLLRVRALTMNDAHMYCRRDQIEAEFESVLRLTQEYFAIFGLKDFWFRLSKWDPNRPDKYIQEPENWEFAEGVLRDVMEKMNLPYKEVVDEAAFYGPKVDVQFKSAIGREETMSTIQLDFAAKKRFNLTYIDQSGAENNEVFVIHRAPLSVHERFLAFLIEHYGGKFPLWLAPTQIAILPISDKVEKEAQDLYKSLKQVGVRAELDLSNNTLGKKIRAHSLQKVPYLAIIGEKEAASGTLTLRTREGEDKGELTKADLLEILCKQIENRI